MQIRFCNVNYNEMHVGMYMWREIKSMCIPACILPNPSVTPGCQAASLWDWEGPVGSMDHRVI